MLDQDRPFLLSIHYSPKSGHAWYKSKIPMGINKLYLVTNELKAGGGHQVTDTQFQGITSLKYSKSQRIPFYTV